MRKIFEYKMEFILVSFKLEHHKRVTFEWLKCERSQNEIVSEREVQSEAATATAHSITFHAHNIFPSNMSQTPKKMLQQWSSSSSAL